MVLAGFVFGMLGLLPLRHQCRTLPDPQRQT
jgi:hypothetical protein